MEQPKRIGELEPAITANAVDQFIVEQPDGRSRRLSLDQVRVLLNSLAPALSGDDIVAMIDTALGSNAWRTGTTNKISTVGTGGVAELYGTGTPGEAYLL